MIHYSRVGAGPLLEPVTLDEAKAHLKVDGTDEDLLITALIVAARQICEAYSGLSFITQTRNVKLDRLCGDVLLPYGPVQSVDSFTYDGDLVTTIDPADYSLDVQSGVARMRSINGWPVTNGYLNNAVVTYKAGYGDTTDTVPEVIKIAIKMVVASLYENRQDEVLGSSPHTMSWSSQALLDTVKVYWNAEA